jgi:hypothetical protein
MRKSDRAALTKWAIAYRDNPNTLPRSPNQALAIQVHEYMSHGEWRTSLLIAIDLKASLSSVRLIMNVISKLWGYKVSKRNGYKRIKD